MGRRPASSRANATASGGPTKTDETQRAESGPADGSKAAPGSDTADPNSVDGQNAQQRSYADKQSSTLTDSKGKPASPGDTKEKAEDAGGRRPPTGRSRWPPRWPSTSSIARPIATIPAGLAITAAGPLIVSATNDTGDPDQPMGLYGDTANAWGTDAGTAKVGIGAAVALNLVNDLDRGDDRSRPRRSTPRA